MERFRALTPMAPNPVRARLRDAVRRFPAAAQLWLKRADASLRHSDWAEPMRALRLREQAFLEAVTTDSRRHSGRKRILFLSLQTPSPWSAIEGSLASALSLRGHDVQGVLCDGLLPVCEMNLGVQERPPCAVCVGWRARYYEGAFGFLWPRLSDYLSREDRDEAVRLIESATPGDLAGLTVDGVEVGRFARRELQRYHRGFVFDSVVDPAFRQWLVSGVLLVRLITRVIDRGRPEIVVASSGRTLVSACMLQVARARNIHGVTWDTEPWYPDGLVFSHDRPAVEIPLDDVWKDAATRALSDQERGALRTFLRGWARSETTPFRYNPTPVEDRAEIAARLGLRPGVPLLVAFANSAWDMAAVDRDVAFSSMFEWLFALVEYARAHPHIDLVVRAHPAEINVPRDLQSRTPVAAEIRRRYAPLPGNVALVAGDSPISSYTLAGMAQVATVYSSRLGLEVALAGKRPWLAGDVTYRGKGFTRDLESGDEMTRLLDQGTFDEVLSLDEIERAERFAYTWLFRYIVRLPWLRPPDGRFALRTFRMLAPGGDPVIDRLCDRFVNGAAFVDLDVEATASAALPPSRAAPSIDLV